MMTPHTAFSRTESRLLQLPPELRLKVLEYLFNRPDLSSSTHRIDSIAFSQGFTDGVGHVTLSKQGDKWKSLSAAKPPGLAICSPAILRTCRLLHEEASDLLYSKVLFVMNILHSSPIAPPFMISAGIQPMIVASPSRRSVFMQSLTNVHIRQHIRPEHDLMQKAYVLHFLLSCLNSKRKTTSITLHFDGIWLVNDGEWPVISRKQDVWQMYAAELARLDLGDDPQIRVSQQWKDLEGIERFEELAVKIGGSVNTSDNYVYW